MNGGGGGEVYRVVCSDTQYMQNGKLPFRMCHYTYRQPPLGAPYRMAKGCHLRDRSIRVDSNGITTLASLLGGKEKRINIKMEGDSTMQIMPRGAPKRVTRPGCPILPKGGEPTTRTKYRLPPWAITRIETIRFEDRTGQPIQSSTECRKLRRKHRDYQRSCTTGLRHLPSPR